VRDDDGQSVQFSAAVYGRLTNTAVTARVPPEAGGAPVLQNEIAPRF